MITILVLGMLLLAAVLGGAWWLFLKLRQNPKFEKLNSRNANKRMLQMTILVYFIGVIIIVYLMGNVHRW